ncbi:poly-gamma-glutamate hydrolase family protein [Priestia endophytica]
MADLYANYAALAAARVEGTDYKINTKELSGVTALFKAIHGGGIEAGTSEIVKEAAKNLASYYEFDAMMSSGNGDLHITSTNFDEPRLLDMMTRHSHVISVHGYYHATEKKTLVGGLDRAVCEIVKDELAKEGFIVEVATGGIAGTETNNVANKTTRGMGVQLELSTPLRQSFFTNNDYSRANRLAGNYTADFWKYVKALKRIMKKTKAKYPFSHVEYDGREDLETIKLDHGSKIDTLQGSTSLVLRPTGGNDTKLINDAITSVSANSKLKRVVLDGSFTVTAPSAWADVIVMKSNVILEFTAGSRITLTPNNFDGYKIIAASELSNIKIINPYIVGDLDGHTMGATPSTQEWCHGIVIQGCNNFEIRNAYIEKCYGDGLNLINSSNKVLLQNGYIDRVRTYKCGRNGVTVASGKNIQIDYIESIETDRIDPKAALDIESNTKGEVWDNIKIGKVVSRSCSGGVMIQPYGIGTETFTSTIDVSIDQVEIFGSGTGNTIITKGTGNTGCFYIDGVDHTKINGRIRVGSLLVDKANRALYIKNILNGGISVYLDNVKLVTSKETDTLTLPNRSAIYMEIPDSLRSTKNIGKVFIKNLEVSGNAEYLFSIIGQNAGTIEKSNVRVNRVMEKIQKPCRLDGIISNISDYPIMESDVTELASIYNSGNTWFTHHFLSTLYHNTNATGDFYLAPSNNTLNLRDTPITIENRKGTSYLGINLTGKTIIPTSLGFVNGFKSNERGARITFKQIDDSTYSIIDKVGNWVTY